MGRTHLNREEDDQALLELERAERQNPKLPFLHYYLGLYYLHQHDYEHAVEEFKKDIEIKPDDAYAYDKLGETYALQQQDTEAEKQYRQEALAAIDEEQKIDPEDYTTHLLRSLVLKGMGQREKAKAEFDIYNRMMNAAREEKGDEEIPNPGLTAEPE
jgi:tetratricopeptide (TPR) repeat protein